MSLRRTVLAVLAACLAITQAGCGSSPTLTRHLDIVLRTETGTGPETTPPAHFPLARYTFFAWEDPSNCLAGIQLVDGHGNVLAGATGGNRSEAANVPPVLVQQELANADYRLRVSTAASQCSWMIEEILNSMPSSEQAPTPERAPPAPKDSMTVTGASPGPIPITATGLYKVTWTVTAQPSDLCPYDVNLKMVSGGLEHVAQEPQPPPEGQPAGPPLGSRGGGTSGGQVIVFLAAGTRTASAGTSCPWTLSVSPLIGPNGGGVRGFASATS